MVIKKEKARRQRSNIFSENLKELLDERDMSQRKAAELIGVSVSMVNNWLQGTVPQDPSVLLGFCKALNCDFQWLLTGEQSSANKGGFNISEVFNIEDEPSFSGIFMLEAKRLTKKNDKDSK